MDLDEFDLKWQGFAPVIHAQDARATNNLLTRLPASRYDASDPAFCPTRLEVFRFLPVIPLKSLLKGDWSISSKNFYAGKN